MNFNLDVASTIMLETEADRPLIHDLPGGLSANADIRRYVHQADIRGGSGGYVTADIHPEHFGNSIASSCFDSSLRYQVGRLQ